MANPEYGVAAPQYWRDALGTYLLISAVGHLAWETAQLPLYTIWSTATPRELAVAVLHCTGGDMLIALGSLMAGLVLAGWPAWPAQRFRRVLVPTLGFGIIFTVLSEWWNVEVSGTWAYSDWMPTLPWIGTGLSPFLQWGIVPTLALRAARARVGARTGAPTASVESRRSQKLT